MYEMDCAGGDGIMEDQLQVTLSSNAGVIVEYQGTKLLIDGIYGTEGHPFSNLGPDRWQRLLSNTAPYDNVDYLLFTHQHPDHFTPKMVQTYLKARGIKGICFPQAVESSQASLVSYLRENRIPCVLLPKQTQRVVFHIEPQIRVCAFSTLHLDKKYRDILHYCYLISFGDKQVLFTADVDYTTETFSAIENVRLRAAFINPLFFNALQRKRFFRGTLDAQTLCIYHVPFTENDSMRMRPVLAQNLLDWPQQKNEAMVLCSAFERIVL
ncbi:MAG: MBL fold metallo-hydrolase [Candidatus Fimivivens sp.]